MWNYVMINNAQLNGDKQNFVESVKFIALEGLKYTNPVITDADDNEGREYIIIYEQGTMLPDTDWLELINYRESEKYKAKVEEKKEPVVITTNVERTIKEGQYINIHASELYLDIPNERVKILHIYENMASVDDKGYLSDVETFAEVHLEGLDRMMDIEKHNIESKRLSDEPWVVYATRGNETQVLPIAEFLAHTTEQ